MKPELVTELKEEAKRVVDSMSMREIFKFLAYTEKESFVETVEYRCKSTPTILNKVEKKPQIVPRKPDLVEEKPTPQPPVVEPEVTEKTEDPVETETTGETKEEMKKRLTPIIVEWREKQDGDKQAVLRSLYSKIVKGEARQFLDLTVEQIKTLEDVVTGKKNISEL